MSTKAEIVVKDVMLPLSQTPIANKNEIFAEVLKTMDAHSLGVTCVLDDVGSLVGIITDGDVRRLLSTSQKPIAALMTDNVAKHSNLSPKTIDENASIEEAISVMSRWQVWDLPVTKDLKLVGLMHLHPALKFVLEKLEKN